MSGVVQTHLAATGQVGGMILDETPLALKHARTPKVEHFGMLAGLEAAVRGMLISAMPLAVYRAPETRSNLMGQFMSRAPYSSWLLHPQQKPNWEHSS